MQQGCARTVEFSGTVTFKCDGLRLTKSDKLTPGGQGDVPAPNCNYCLLYRHCFDDCIILYNIPMHGLDFLLIASVVHPYRVWLRFLLLVCKFLTISIQLPRQTYGFLTISSHCILHLLQLPLLLHFISINSHA